MLSRSLVPTRIGLALAVASALTASNSASAERLVSATIGLNYLGEGQCTVVNAGADAATVGIFIIDAATGNALNSASGVVIPAGLSLTLPYQALTANKRAAYCEVEKVTQGAKIRMAFRRVFFNGDVSDSSDGLPAGTAESYGNTSEPGKPGVKTIFVTSTTHTGDLGGLTGADAICQSLADSPSSIVPKGEYVALLSTDQVDGGTRPTPAGGPYISARGLPVAHSTPDLFNTENDHLVNFIGNDELGASYQSLGVIGVWTGTTGHGRYRLNMACLNWESDDSNDSGRIGNTVGTDDGWLDSVDEDCSELNRLYCVQR